MGDSQQPKPALPQFEVPDLELEPVPRSKRALPAAVSAPSAPTLAAEYGYGGANLFDDDALSTGSPTLDLASDVEQYGAVQLDSGPGFDTSGNIELDGNADTASRIAAEVTPPSTSPTSSEARRASAAWLNRLAPVRERLPVDPLELSLFANYGQPPKNPYLTPLYAYRVFTRQREIKQALRPLQVEQQRAEAERQSALTELALAVRSDAEPLPQFRQLFAPLSALEEIAGQRGQALSSIRAELDAQAKALDAELIAIGDQLVAEQAAERDAQRLYDERDAAAQRAEAKLKRVHIEMRAVSQVARQKPGAQGGTVPEPEASQLALLKQRAEAAEPEIDQTRAEVQKARAMLDQAAARVDAVRQSERQVNREKQALVRHYQAELDAQSRGQSEAEQQGRAALAEIGRAVLAARGAVAAPEPLLERVRSSSQRADALLLQCELHLGALTAYDRARVAQGVRLACTFVALFLLLIVLKIAL